MNLYLKSPICLTLYNYFLSIFAAWMAKKLKNHLARSPFCMVEDTENQGRKETWDLFSHQPSLQSPLPGSHA